MMMMQQMMSVMNMFQQQNSQSADHKAGSAQSTGSQAAGTPTGKASV
jgi:hypothetical protein